MSASVLANCWQRSSIFFSSCSLVWYKSWSFFFISSASSWLCRALISLLTLSCLVSSANFCASLVSFWYMSRIFSDSLGLFLSSWASMSSFLLCVSRNLASWRDSWSRSSWKARTFEFLMLMGISLNEALRWTTATTRLTG
ncbi:hypothetical protein BpHYR1_032360 [Brachionus plicatilis]|uniref:Uncharacterized protein n=1 Tax=Brachionus plicatilis TaxID=10195 RepID=A0A3M7P7Q9_BRAPC|nr:hypothetical protein BpHYR1_032360 [Brachionus plicatilis]